MAGQMQISIRKHHHRQACRHGQERRRWRPWFPRSWPRLSVSARMSVEAETCLHSSRYLIVSAASRSTDRSEFSCSASTRESHNGHLNHDQGWAFPEGCGCTQRKPLDPRIGAAASWVRTILAKALIRLEPSNVGLRNLARFW